MDLIEFSRMTDRIKMIKEMRNNNFDQLQIEEENEFTIDERNELRQTNGFMDMMEVNSGGFTGIMQNLEYQQVMKNRD